uniref:hypothetical protein n=1 Tax=Galdieria phlegrea TaxID=1389228 RepID=UPI0023D878F3|nr:hypothetical protein P2030_pgp110 [Galdieria phlegrea]WDA99829.1 hypothetical protein GAPH629S_097 [Galdieria phlegrea]
MPNTNLYSVKLAYIFSILYVKSYSRFSNEVHLIKPFNIFNYNTRKRIFVLIILHIESFVECIINNENNISYKANINKLLFNLLIQVINETFYLSYELNQKQLESWWLTKKFFIENECLILLVKLYLKNVSLYTTEITYLLETIILNFIDYVSKFFLYTIFINKNIKYFKHRYLNLCLCLLLGDLLNYYIVIIKYICFNKYKLFTSQYNGQLKYRYLCNKDIIYHIKNYVNYFPIITLVVLFLNKNIIMFLNIITNYIRQKKFLF